MGGTGHVERRKKIRNARKILAAKLEGMDYLGDLGTDERVIPKLILKKQGVVLGSVFNTFSPIGSNGELLWTR
jgi:hypothetical protein